MLDLDLQLKKLQQLHDVIVRMPDNKERAILISNYDCFTEMLCVFFPDDEMPFSLDEFALEKSYLKYEKYFYTEIRELYDSILFVKDLLGKVNSVNRDHGLVRYVKLDKKINADTGILLLEEFFNSMPDYITKVYKEVFNGNLCFTSGGGSFAYNIEYGDVSKVRCDGNFNSYLTYAIVAHEIGHCYHNRLDVKSNNFTYAKSDVEVPSIFMEILFNLFVDEKLYNQEYGISTLFRRQSMFANWTEFENFLISNGLDYGILNENELSIYFKRNKLSDADKARLREQYKVSDDELNQECFGLSLNIYSFRYILSNLFAIYFADIYMQDKKEGLRLLKDYLMLPPGVSFGEKLQMYDLTGDSYKKMIKKVSDYGKKEHILY